MFFNRPDLDLATAVPGSFSLWPAPAMRDRLERDYENMQGMIFGSVPPFDQISKTVSSIEEQLNSSDPSPSS